MSTARTIYEKNVESLPPLEQLRLASLILEHLTHAGKVEVESSDAWSDEDIADLTKFSLRYSDRAGSAKESDV